MRGLHMRAKPFVTSHSSRRWYGLSLAKGLVLATRKRVDIFLDCHLFPNLVFFQLVLDILCYLFRIFPCCVHIVPSAPKLPISLFLITTFDFL